LQSRTARASEPHANQGAVHTQQILSAKLGVRISISIRKFPLNMLREGRVSMLITTPWPATPNDAFRKTTTCKTQAALRKCHARKRREI
jgi:hypothetical protein